MPRPDDHHEHRDPGAPPTPDQPARRRPPGGLLAGMRIRKKLLFLHTCFSLGLALVLLVSLRPSVARIMDRAEVDEGTLLLRTLRHYTQNGGRPESFAQAVSDPDNDAPQRAGTTLRVGTSRQVGLTDGAAAQVRAAGGAIVRPDPGADPVTLAMMLPPSSESASDPTGTSPESALFAVATTRIEEARAAVVQLFALLVGALLAVYALVAISLEVFVMPQHVYDPIRRMREADEAVRQGRKDQEIIPDASIPRDELGEIMRSRNESIRALREHEAALASAFGEIERVATDLRRKNHLLERARQNLRDADRLASLGMMSAGIAHELNTPLAVLKGMVERINASPRAGVDASQAALMLRVVKRLERLGESLLDFARVRPPQTHRVTLSELVDEAVTLVRLDRGSGDITIQNAVPPGLELECDGDRMVQVLVNLTRNAMDAIRRARPPAASSGAPLAPSTPNATTRPGHITLAADTLARDDEQWTVITITDDGPGIDPDVLPRLFEPFASTALDARGTGLGLAVSEGIVREHAGVLLAKNRADGQSGAVFEILLPSVPARPTFAAAAPGESGRTSDPAPPGTITP